MFFECHLNGKYYSISLKKCKSRVVGGVVGCASCIEATVLAAVGPGSSPALDGLCCVSFSLSLPPISYLSSTVLSITGIKSPPIK